MSALQIWGSTDKFIDLFSVNFSIFSLTITFSQNIYIQRMNLFGGYVPQPHAAPEKIGPPELKKETFIPLVLHSPCTQFGQI